jgi:hypothetical protein
MRCDSHIGMISTHILFGPYPKLPNKAYIVLSNSIKQQKTHVILSITHFIIVHIIYLVLNLSYLIKYTLSSNLSKKKKKVYIIKQQNTRYL